MDSLGPFSDVLNITRDNFRQKFPLLEASDVNNGLILEVNSFTKKSSLKWTDIREFLCLIFGVPNDSLADSAVCTSFSAVKKKAEKVKGKKSDQKHVELHNRYLNELYSLPVSVGKRAPICHAVTPPPKRVRLDPDIDEKRRKRQERIELYLQNVVPALKQKNKLLRKQLAAKHKRTYETRALNRIKNSRQLWKTKYLELKSTKVKIVRKKRKRRQRLAREKALEIENADLKKTCQNSTAALREQSDELKSYKLKFSVLENELEEAREEIETLQAPFANTKQDGKTYSNMIREASYKLLDSGISESNVSLVLRYLYEIFTGKKLVGELPSNWSQNRFAFEMKNISSQHVMSEVQGQKYTTLKYDGTTKVGSHLVEVELATKDKTFLVGIKDQVGGTAAEYADTIVFALEDIQTAGDDTEPEDLLQNVSNTMSDRCITNSAVDTRLEGVKGAPLNSLRCAMHPLDSFAKECDKVLISLQDDSPFPIYMRRGESRTQALVRYGAKLFHDPQFNCRRELTSFLLGHPSTPGGDKRKKVLYYRFVGSRFHMYFLQAGLLYHYTVALTEFFAKEHRPKNIVQECFFKVLSKGDLLVNLQALGLVGKLITAPWMRLVEKEMPVLELNPYFQEAVQTLESYIQTPELMLHHDAKAVFSDIDVNRDEVFATLTDVSSLSEERLQALKSCLQSLCRAILTVVQRQLSSQLEGGRFHEPSDELLEAAQSCSSTNISGERRFAHYDSYQHKARNATVAKIEGRVMFRSNHSADWLSNLSAEQKAHVIAKARKKTSKMVTADRDRQKNIANQVIERLRGERNKLKEKDEKKRKDQEDILEEVMECVGGLWLTEEDLKLGCSGLSKTGQKKVIKAQIKARTELLKCKEHRKIVKSKATVEELGEFFNELLKVELPEESDLVVRILKDPDILVGQDISQTWENEDGLDENFSGLVESVTVNQLGKKEFTLKFEADDKEYFMQPEEIIIDLIRGDMAITV